MGGLLITFLFLFPTSFLLNATRWNLGLNCLTTPHNNTTQPWSRQEKTTCRTVCSFSDLEQLRGSKGKGCKNTPSLSPGPNHQPHCLPFFFYFFFYHACLGSSPSMPQTNGVASSNSKFNYDVSVCGERNQSVIHPHPPYIRRMVNLTAL